MQSELYEDRSNDDSTTPQNATKKEVEKELHVKCKELTNVQQYVCFRGAGAEPPVRKTVAQSKVGQRSQRVRSVVHALRRTSFSEKRPSVKQQNIPLIVDFSHVSFPTIEKEKRITILRTMNHQINLLFMM